MEHGCFFFDFDNTLYSHKSKCVPESARFALTELRRKGHKLAIATGRGLESVDFIESESGIVFDARILLNGQQVYLGDDLIFEKHINVSPSDEILQTASDHGLSYGGCREYGNVVNELSDRVRIVCSDFRCNLPEVDPLLSSKQNLYMLHLYVSKDEEYLFRNIDEKYILNRSHEFLLNLLPRSAGKSTGVDLVLAAECIPVKESVAFGDGYNDVDMLQHAGIAIAMADGDERLKKYADLIAMPADDDGILNSLRKIGIL